ncbi:MAG TPA: phytanoyl-CoA dioxygenase family protein [Burkholderiales bacterium]|nr:phytanoyl-CoA dioxygenase family protein [Burkholderiales bacterium]
MTEVFEGGVTLTRERHAARLEAYTREGVRLAGTIGNRGPVRFDARGRLAADIEAAYRKHGFYIFEGVVGAQEVEALRRDALEMLERAPVAPDAKVDASGRPALGLDARVAAYNLIKPLSDPVGGTSARGGRYPTRMAEAQPDDDAPRFVVLQMRGMCQHMPAGLRLYGHPKLLAIAASINGDDFVPFNDVIFVKQPGLGGSVAWHQDGVTHWDNPQWDEGIHGFNYQVQLYPTTAANALWVVPGTHKQGRVDIRKMVADNGGGELLPGAIPLICAAGDVTIVNRQTLHGSFANSSPDMRISITYGFHRRSSVLGAKAALHMQAEGVTYDAQRIDTRSAVIALAIDARRRHYADEKPFSYRPFEGRESDYAFTPATFERVIRDYNINDLAI